MGGLHSQEEAMYIISCPKCRNQPKHKVYVYACWDGEWWYDKDRFYDLYDERGRHLNLGEPWHDDPDVPEELAEKWDEMETWDRSEIRLTGGDGVPTLSEIQDAMDTWKPWEETK